MRGFAPFAGLLETDTAELGALLQTGSPCATIIQLDPIKFVGFVPEAELYARAEAVFFRKNEGFVWRGL